MPRTFVFDAYGTLFDVHAAIGRYRAAAGPDADRFSEFWNFVGALRNPVLVNAVVQDTSRV